MCQRIGKSTESWVWTLVFKSQLHPSLATGTFHKSPKLLSSDRMVNSNTAIYSTGLLGDEMRTLLCKQTLKTLYSLWRLRGKDRSMSLPYPCSPPCTLSSPFSITPLPFFSPLLPSPSDYGQILSVLLLLNLSIFLHSHYHYLSHPNCFVRTAHSMNSWLLWSTDCAKQLSFHPYSNPSS